jgi:sulfotransferase family protein
MKIAMWSGPRNLSTAMMYAFVARGDCAVWDEPFYAPYLKATGSDHPLAAQIIAAHESDPAKVAARCLGPVPGGKKHFYMKHMPHHMLPGFPLTWTADCVHVHLIRHPARVIASYAAKREDPTLHDIGFPQQMALYEAIGGVVVDSHDIRANPREMLQKLCSEIDLDFTETMLHWPAGGHRDDGVWAQHWYGAVWNSTGFAGPEAALPDLSGAAADLLQQASPYYQEFSARKLR